MKRQNEESAVDSHELDRGGFEESGISYISDFARFQKAMKRIFARRQTLEEELVDLELARTGSIPSRDRLTAANAGVIISVVDGSAIRNKAIFYSRPLEPWDLLQEGVFGMHVAIKRYKPMAGKRLSSYAQFKVMYCVTKALAGNLFLSSPPRTIGKMAKILEQKRRIIAQKIGHEPTRTEILKELSPQSRAYFVRAEMIVAQFSPANGVDAFGDEDFTAEVPEVSAENDEYQEMRIARLCQILGQSDVLSPAQRRIIDLRYLASGDSINEVPFREIKDKAGIDLSNAWRTNQIALSKLRKAF